MRAEVRHLSLGRLGCGGLEFVFVALSGPGRIDIVDGQTRYAVACSETCGRRALSVLAGPALLDLVPLAARRGWLGACGVAGAALL